MTKARHISSLFQAYYCSGKFELWYNLNMQHIGSAVIHAVKTSGERFISSLHCVAKKREKRVPELGGRELTDLSPYVLTA